MDNQKDLVNLPVELQYEIFESLPPSSLINLCSIKNRAIQSVCLDEHFWKKRVKRDLSGLIEKPFIGNSWRKSWKYAMESIIVTIPMYYGIYVYDMSDEEQPLIQDIKLPMREIGPELRKWLVNNIKDNFDSYLKNDPFDEIKIIFEEGNINILHHATEDYWKTLPLGYDFNLIKQIFSEIKDNIFHAYVGDSEIGIPAATREFNGVPYWYLVGDTPGFLDFSFSVNDIEKMNGKYLIFDGFDNKATFSKSIDIDYLQENAKILDLAREENYQVQLWIGHGVTYQEGVVLPGSRDVEVVDKIEMKYFIPEAYFTIEEKSTKSKGKGKEPAQEYSSNVDLSMLQNKRSTKTQKYYTVKEIKNFLDERRLSKVGKKEELIKRLRDYENKK